LRNLAKVQGEVIKAYYGIKEEKINLPGGKEDPLEVEKLYRVQVGAFRHKENALRMIDALENDGYPTYLVAPK